MVYQCTHCAQMSIEHLVVLARQEWTPHTFPKTAFYQHHASIVELEASALEGCAFCRIVLERFNGTLGVDIDPAWDFPKEWTGPQCERSKSIFQVAKDLERSDVKIALNSSHSFLHEGLGGGIVLDEVLVQVGDVLDLDQSFLEEICLPALSLSITVPPGQIVMIDGLRIGQFKVDENLGSDFNHAMARRWLELPTRVVDVGPKDGSRAPRVFHSGGHCAPYVTLSHCWGGPVPMLLTTKTLRSFQDAIPYASLPANFRDCITVTRQLGIQYVWIDSLCIIQDSKEDWANESKTMSTVYRHSTITMSAMASEKSTRGILSYTVPSSPLRFASAPMKMFAHSLHSEFVTIEALSHQENLNHLDDHSALASRGWVLQESLLSPRQLYYGRHQIYYKCLSGYQSADGVSRGSRVPFYQWLNTTLVLFHDILRRPRPVSFNIHGILEDYYGLVSDYTGRKLTFSSDKLPALSGISQLLHPAIGGDYMAGLWSADFHRGLLWYPELRHCAHAEEYRAPSWSWAVTDEKVIFAYALEPGPLDLQLREWSVGLRDDSNSFGQVDSGHVLVEGLTIPFVRSGQILAGQNPRKHSVGNCYFDAAVHDTSVVHIFRLRTEDDQEDFLASVYTAVQSPEQDNWTLEEQFVDGGEYLALVVSLDEGEERPSKWDEDSWMVPQAQGLILRCVKGPDIPRRGKTPVEMIKTSGGIEELFFNAENGAAGEEKLEDSSGRHMQDEYEDCTYERAGYFDIRSAYLSQVRHWSWRTLTII